MEAKQRIPSGFLSKNLTTVDFWQAEIVTGVSTKGILGIQLKLEIRAEVRSHKTLLRTPETLHQQFFHADFPTNSKTMAVLAQSDYASHPELHERNASHISALNCLRLLQQNGSVRLADHLA